MVVELDVVEIVDEVEADVDVKIVVRVIEGKIVVNSEERVDVVLTEDVAVSVEEKDEDAVVSEADVADV